MNKLLKKFLLVAMAAVMTVCVAACDEEEKVYSLEETLYDVDYKAYAKLDLNDVLASIGDLEKLDAATKANVNAAYQAGLAAIEAAESNQDIYAQFKAAKSAIIAALPKANGVYSYLSLPNSERTEILGLLEAYAVRNGIAGISLFENGGYVMYNERLQLGTENYITGYGFGNLAEGRVTQPMDAEENADWKMYYHTYDASDPGTANALNDKGSQVSDVYGYMGGSFFTTFMNEEKNGYDWVPELANTKPQAVNPDENNMATTWEFPIKTDVKYSTNSEIASRAAFNGRTVEAEDYITPFKLLLTKKNDYARGAEMASTDTGAIVGASTYYEASADGFNAEAWKSVGVKVYEKEEGSGQYWFQYSFTEPTTQFYSMYYITSNLYQPIPQDFLDLVGVENYLGFNEDGTETPVDNGLALGAYVLESWAEEQAITYSKNENYVFAETKYATPGIHIAILKALESNPNAAFEEFLIGKLDSTGIPQEYLNEYKNDVRTKTTTGDSNFKLNVNATDAETWEYLFGENGVVAQTPKSEYWTVEPALSNPHFVRALSLSIDRVTFADKRGSIPSVEYLSSNYMSDPENGISYSSTDAHKNAVSTLLRDTDGFGYSLDNAREYFKLAIQELVMEQAYEIGTPENPTKIELEIAWMYPTHEDNYHKEIEQFLETAFNHYSVSGKRFVLDVKFWVGAEWDDVYYDKMMKGQYDLGFGSISGNSLNPLDFVSVLSSDQTISGNFTLNWGTNTNDADADVLVYNGVQWSFDSLWKAANATAVVSDGTLTSIYCGSELVKSTENADGSVTLEIKASFNKGEGYSGKVQGLVLYTYKDISQDMAGTASTYNEYALDASQYTIVDNEDGSQTITVTVSAANIADLKLTHALAYGSGYSGIDVYYTEVINGVEKGATFGTSIVGEEFIAAPAAE